MQQTMEQFVRDNKLSMEVKRITRRPDGLMEGSDGQRHFKCRLTRRVEVVVPTKWSHDILMEEKGFNLYFSQGSAHTEPPTIEDVLDCLAMDATGYEEAPTFEDWASEYGYDTDSRKAEKIYKTVCRQALQLKRTLGESAHQKLLYEVERL